MKWTRSIPALPVQEIDEAIHFHRDKLGFVIRHHERDFAIAVRDDVEIHLWAACDHCWATRPSFVTTPVSSGAESFIAGTASCRIEVQGIDELYTEYEKRGVLHGPDTKIEVTPWGTREFAAVDLDRNLLTFFERP